MAKKRIFELEETVELTDKVVMVDSAVLPDGQKFDLSSLDKKIFLETDIYVETTGSDNTGDGSIALPYETIKRALQDIQDTKVFANVRIHVGIGTFEWTSEYKSIIASAFFAGGSLSIIGTTVLNTTLATGLAEDPDPDTFRYIASVIGTFTENQFRSMLVRRSGGGGTEFYPISYTGAGTDSFRLDGNKHNLAGSTEIHDYGTVINLDVTDQYILDMDTRFAEVNFTFCDIVVNHPSGASIVKSRTYITMLSCRITGTAIEAVLDIVSGQGDSVKPILDLKRVCVIQNGGERGVNAKGGNSLSLYLNESTIIGIGASVACVEFASTMGEIADLVLTESNVGLAMNDGAEIYTNRKLKTQNVTTAITMARKCNLYGNSSSGLILEGVTNLFNFESLEGVFFAIGTEVIGTYTNLDASGLEHTYDPSLGFALLLPGVSEPYWNIIDVDTDLYVETTGSDVTGDGTVGNPYASILRTLQDLERAEIKAAVNVHVGVGTFQYTTDCKVLINSATFNGGSLNFTGIMSVNTTLLTLANNADPDPLSYDATIAVAATENQFRGMSILRTDEYYPISWNSAGASFILDAAKHNLKDKLDIYDYDTVIETDPTDTTCLDVISDVYNVTFRYLKLSILSGHLDFNGGRSNLIFIDSAIYGTAATADKDMISITNLDGALHSSFKFVRVYLDNAGAEGVMLIEAVKKDQVFLEALVMSSVLQTVQHCLVIKDTHVSVIDLIIDAPGAYETAVGMYNEDTRMYLHLRIKVYRAGAILLLDNGVSVLGSEKSQFIIATNNSAVNYLMKTFQSPIYDVQLNIVLATIGTPVTGLTSGFDLSWWNPKAFRNISLSGLWGELETGLEDTLPDGGTKSIDVGGLSQNNLVIIEYVAIRGAAMETGKVTITNDALFPTTEEVYSGDASISFAATNAGDEIVLNVATVAGPGTGTFKANIQRVMI